VRPWRLVGDAGGSNVRFARASAGNVLAERRTYSVPHHASFYDALRLYLAETGGPEGCASAAVGVAGPVDEGRVKLTNAPWTIDARDTAQALGGAPTQLVNDLQAVALALPHLTEAELLPLGGAVRGSAPRQTMLALNVGTGFGGASCIPSRDSWMTVGSEPGHMTFGATDADQLGVIQGCASVEHLFSGRGVEALYARLAARRGHGGGAPLKAAAIFANAAADAVAAETVQHFSVLLGRIAGDLVLAAGAWGGVYLCGSVVQGWAAVAGKEDFRAQFEAKGPMSARMQGVFSGVIRHDDVSLAGLTHLGIEGCALRGG